MERKEYLHNFEDEIYNFWSFIHYSKIIEFNQIKNLYKWESPDFIIEIKNGEYISVEYINACCESTHKSNEYKIKNGAEALENVRKIMKEKRILVFNCSQYENISENNLSSIFKHLNKKENYYKNIKDYFNNDKNIEILFLINFDPGPRIMQVEKNGIFKLINNLKDINKSNVYINLKEKEQNCLEKHWINLNEVPKEDSNFWLTDE